MDAFVGEIRAFPYTFTPADWLLCDGTQYNVQQYQALAAVIGSVYGGDGFQTFKVPDLRGQAVLGSNGVGTAPNPVNQKTGKAAVTLDEGQLPSHNHNLQTQGNTTRLAAPSNAALMLFPRYNSPVDHNDYNIRTYVPAMTGPTKVPMNPATLAPAGSGQPHPNLSPFVIFNFCICAIGTFPVQN
ncbi:Microcystin-dependent protein [Methylobacterium sp. 174MFSha1.1]|uniref:phage tail protein n=1 Tax=Methylobacterium sp. 174MFSha1.1 TaxID=1502749 RepID=UPI0008EAF046|nr:tail fiber protein [Methylobacterium sp. 174MFSha1.1]SFV08855.1 Microcystin-dependent protein [Methylobacterium sp. 174MFSha1.1]